MTVDSATLSFLEKLDQDASMQSELEGALEGAQDKTGVVIALAAKKGYRIDRVSLDAARAALKGASRGSGAMDERELEAVAGGFNPQPEPPALTGMVQRIRPATKSLLTSWGP
jgi:hypothetical protein